MIWLIVIVIQINSAMQVNRNGWLILQPAVSEYWFLSVNTQCFLTAKRIVGV